MALRSQKKARPSGEASSQWLSLDQARAILGVASEDIVRAWAQKYRWLRSRTLPNGELQVLRDDVLYRKQEREALSAIGGEELTPEELESLHNARPGTLPWQQGQATPAA